MAQNFPHPFATMANNHNMMMIHHERPAEMLLYDRLRSQVEYYFSPQNLANDTFLQSLLQQRDHFGAVPLDVIANFRKIRQYYAAAFNIQQVPLPPADLSVLARALYGSPVVQISADGKWIFPTTRTTVAATMKRPIPTQQHQPTSTTSIADSDGSQRVPSSSSPSSPTSQTTAASSVGGIPTHPLREPSRVVLGNVPLEYEREQVLQLFTDTSRPTRREGPTVWTVSFDTKEEALQAATAIQERSDLEIHADVTPDQLNGAPRPHHPMPVHPVAQQPVQHYPVMTLPPGYIPYGTPSPYGVPVVPHHQTMPMPTPYPYVRVIPPHVQPQYMRYDMRPYPSHVYVREQQHSALQEHGGGRRVQPKRRSKKRSKRVQMKQGAQVRDNAHEEHPPPPPPPQIREERINSRPLSESSLPKNKADGRNDNRRDRGKRQGTKEADRSTKDEILTEEHFPTLGDKKSDSERASAEPPKAAYAAALLKPISAPKPTGGEAASDGPSSGESTSQLHSDKRQAGACNTAEGQIEKRLSALKVTANVDTAESSQLDQSLS